MMGERRVIQEALFTAPARRARVYADTQERRPAILSPAMGSR